jgi:hypothetical protein
MSGLDYPLDRGASSKNPALLAGALQSRPSSLFFGPRLPHPHLNLPVMCNVIGIVSTDQAECCASCIERTSPRVPPLGPRGMSVVEFLRTTECSLFCRWGCGLSGRSSPCIPGELLDSVEHAIFPAITEPICDNSHRTGRDLGPTPHS